MPRSVVNVSRDQEVHPSLSAHRERHPQILPPFYPKAGLGVVARKLSAFRPSDEGRRGPASANPGGAASLAPPVQPETGGQVTIGR